MRTSKDDNIFFCVKNYWLSFQNLIWITEKELLEINNLNKSKINKFKSQWQKSECEEGEYINYDHTWTEIDRILLCSDMFSIIHPKKAQEINLTFLQSLKNVVISLINYENSNFCYGIHLLRLDDYIPADMVENGNYLDFSILLNKIYMNHYKSSNSFWQELGEFYNFVDRELGHHGHILKLTYILRQLSVSLYYQWFEESIKKVEELNSFITQFGEGNSLRQLRREVFSLFSKLSKENTHEENLKLKQEILDFSSSFFNNFPELLMCRSIITNFLNSNGNDENEIMNREEIIYSSLLKCEGNLKDYIETVESNLKVALKIDEFRPGNFSISWSRVSLPVDLSFFGDNTIDLNNSEKNKYLVKWNNQSYADMTWEPETKLSSFENKISSFKFVNRTLDKKSRDKLLQKINCLRKYNEFSNKQVNMFKQKEMKELKKQILEKRDRGVPVAYNDVTQPIFREGRRLRSYQLESLNWLIKSWKQKRNVILADEMGLGKTIQSMAFLNYLYTFERIQGPFLILAPLTTLQHWKRVFEDWSNLNCVCYYDTKSREGRMKCSEYEFYIWEVLMKGSFIQSNQYIKFNVLLTSFEVFMQDFTSVFSQLPFQFIIVDEAHRLKNKNAKILNFLKNLSCNRVLLLTGTPIQNNISELWTLLNYLEPKNFPDESLFLSKFGDIKNSDSLNELKKEIEPFLLRRLKEDVETSIPPLSEMIIEIELTQLQKMLYKTLYEKNKGTLQKGLGLNYVSIMNNLEMQLRKCCDHPYLLPEIRSNYINDNTTNDKLLEALIFSSAKLSFLDKLLLRSKSKCQKTLVFSQFTEMLKIIEEYLALRGWPYEKIDGSTRARDRQSSIDRFNSNINNFEIFLLSTKAGGLGINLTAANIVVIYDSDWNPQNDLQAIARAHRIGQTAQVSVFRLVAKKTYEAEMLERASKKLGLDQAIFLGNTFGCERDKLKEEDNYKKLKPEELDTLLRRGIIGLLESQEEAKTDAAAYEALDIDSLIENAPKTNYSLSNNGYTISKTKFADETTSKIQMDDPDFWKKVLVEKEPLAVQLMQERKMAKEQKSFKNLDFQKTYCLKLFGGVQSYLEQRMKNEGFSADTEYDFLNILNILSEDKELIAPLRELVTEIKSDFKRNSRRIKKVDPKTVELIIKKAAEAASRKSKRIIRIDPSQERIKKVSRKSDENLLSKREIFSSKKKGYSNDGSYKNEDASGVFEEDSPLRTNKPKKLQPTLNKYCLLCGANEPDLKCNGLCQGNYHRICLEYKRKFLFEELTSTLREDICCFCKNNIQVCFKCDKLGQVSENHETSNPTKTYKCSNCTKFYHPGCIEPEIPKDISKGFVCQSHFCESCKEFSKELYYCIKCPVSFHKKCMSKKNKVIQANLIECYHHQRSNWRSSKTIINPENQAEIYKSLGIELPALFDYLHSNKVS